jgi:hypothetical protein
MEIATSLTNLVLAASCFYWGMSLFWQTSSIRSVFTKLWSLGFLFVAASAFWGSIYHIYTPRDAFHSAYWILTYGYLLASQAIFILAIFTDMLKIKVGPIYIASVLMFFTFLISALVYTRSFSILIVAYLLVLVSLLIYAFWHYMSSNRIFEWCLGGLVISLIAGCIQRSTVKLGYFDNNAIFHVVELFGLYCLYKAVAQKRNG